MSEGSHAGRPRSWVAVSIIFVGFLAGGVALVLGPSWPLFWAGVAVVVVGGFLTVAVGTFADVVLDKPRVIPEVVDYSLIGRRTELRRGGSFGETTDKPTQSDTEETPRG